MLNALAGASSGACRGVTRIWPVLSRVQGQRQGPSYALRARLQELADVELDGHNERVQQAHVAAAIDLVQVVVLIGVLQLSITTVLCT